jgi:hypothetical protein
MIDLSKSDYLYLVFLVYNNSQWIAKIPIFKTLSQLLRQVLIMRIHKQINQSKLYTNLQIA